MIRPSVIANLDNRDSVEQDEKVNEWYKSFVQRTDGVVWQEALDRSMSHGFIKLYFHADQPIWGYGDLLFLQRQALGI
jgi:hypothetical protein